MTLPTSSINFSTGGLYSVKIISHNGYYPSLFIAPVPICEIVFSLESAFHSTCSLYYDASTGVLILVFPNQSYLILVFTKILEVFLLHKEHPSLY